MTLIIQRVRELLAKPEAWRNGGDGWQVAADGTARIVAARSPEANAWSFYGAWFRTLALAAQARDEVWQQYAYEPGCATSIVQQLYHALPLGENLRLTPGAMLDHCFRWAAEPERSHPELLAWLDRAIAMPW